MLKARWHVGLLFILISISSLISGCTAEFQPLPVPTNTVQNTMIGVVGGAGITALFAPAMFIPAGALVGGIALGALGNYIDRNMTLEQKLTRQGVRVIRVGDNVRLFIPVDKFFFHDSQVINPKYYPVLNMIAFYLREFRKVTIKVAGYTDNRCTQKRNIPFSYLQADHVATYLWRCKVDARIIYAIGYGDKFPLANNTNPRGRGLNRRIVISFRVLHLVY